MPITPEGYWVPDLMLKQFEVFNARERFLLVHGPRFASKCIDADSIVMAGDRLIRLARMGPDLKRGDYALLSSPITAFDANSRKLVTTRTSGFYRNHSKSAIRLTTVGGYTIVGSPVHPLWSSCEGVEDYRPLSEIAQMVKNGAVLYLPIIVGFDGWTFGTNQVVDFIRRDKKIRKRHVKANAISAALKSFPAASLKKLAEVTGIKAKSVEYFFRNRDTPTESVQIDESLAYFLGVLTGDGCTTKKNLDKHRVGLATLDAEIIDSAREVIQKHFTTAVLRHISGCDWTISCSKLFGLIERLGMDCYAHEKRIPNEIIESPKLIVRAFLQGLFDTDGSCSKNGYVSYCTSSRRLADDVRVLLLAFGVVTYTTQVKNDFRGAWLIGMGAGSRQFSDKIGFRLERKQQRTKNLGAGKPHIRNSLPFKALRWKDRHSKAAMAKIDAVTAGGVFMWKELLTAESVDAELFDLTVPAHHSFIADGLINHNTWGILAKVCRHLWEVDGARVAVVSKIVKTARHGGSFDLLTKVTMSEWIDSGIGFELTCGPQTDSVTKTPFFRIRNRHGTESECFLFSLSSEKEVEERFKNTEFSLIYFIELSNFDVRAVFDQTWPCLRMSTVPFEQHQWMADTNPAKEGEDHWIYKLWMQERLDEKTLPFLRDNLRDIQFTIDDNTRLDPRQKEALWAAYQFDKDLLDRFYWGKWTRSTADGHFSEVFIPNIHIVGDATSPRREDWELIVPPETCYEFFGGWDLGDIHHSFHLATKRIVNDLTVFDFIDELVILNTKTSVADFTEMIMEKIEFWEQFMLSEYGRKELKWRHWSDRSAFTYKSAADAEDELTVRNVSDGKIMLMALSGGQLGGSVRTRVSLWKKLLFEKRVFISAQLTFLLGMVRGLRQGPGNEVVQRKNNPIKHSFDSSSYLLIGEAPTDTEMNFRPDTKRTNRVITLAAA